ncbi:MAG: histidine phosphatase family protein [Thioalkalispiraceae bacterium]
MRHGQTNYNVLGLCNDVPERNVYLTDLGKQQARLVADKIRNRAIEAIIVSELPRTRQTAEIINQDHHVPIITQPLLNDIRTGMDGRPVIEYFSRIEQDPLHTTINNGESLLEHKQRVMKYFDWLKTQKFNYLLTIAHEETLRVFYAWFNQLGDEKLPDLHFDNCELLYYEF